MKKTTTVTTKGCTQLSADFAQRNQTWEYRRTVKLPNGTKVRLTLQRNAYDFQSHAYSEAFSPTDLRWNRIDSVPFTNALCCFNVSYVEKMPDVTKFKADAKMLLKRALMVLA